jgi:hypothetical protein
MLKNMFINLLGKSIDGFNFGVNKKAFSFRNPVELLIILSLLFFSLFVFNGYLLNIFNLPLNIANSTLLLIIDVIILALNSKKVKIFLALDLKLTVFCVVVFLIVIFYSAYHSPDYLPLSGSSDAVHNYVLIEYLYNHESLPNLNQSYYMGEMVYYPFGPSLVTADIPYPSFITKSIFLHSD